jgi:type I restriction enzyme S subunit
VSLTITPAEIVEKAEASGRPGLLAKAPEWDRIQLGDVARVVNGAPFPSAGFNSDGRGMPLIRIRDVTLGNTQTWFDGAWEPQHLVRHGDVLVGMDGDFRVERWRGDDALLNQRVCRIDIGESKYDARFLSLVLQGYLDAIWQETSSVTVKHLSSRTIAAVPLPCPSLDEQRHLVNLLEDHLSRLGAARKLIATSLRRLRALRVSLLADLHVGIPAAMGELAVDAGYGTSEKCVPDGPGPAVVRIPNLVDGQIDLTDEKRIASPDADVAPYQLEPGDLLIVRTNGSVDLIGRSAVVQDGVDAAFASYLIRYQLDPDRVDPRWAHAMLSSPAVRARIETLAVPARASTTSASRNSMPCCSRFPVSTRRPTGCATFLKSTIGSAECAPHSRRRSRAARGYAAPSSLPPSPVV